MSWFGMGERRFRPREAAVARINCRVCYAAVDLHPEFVEKVELGHVMHCPSCRCTFPVRWDDSIEGRMASYDATAHPPEPEAAQTTSG